MMYRINNMNELNADSVVTKISNAGDEKKKIGIESKIKR